MGDFPLPRFISFDYLRVPQFLTYPPIHRSEWVSKSDCDDATAGDPGTRCVCSQCAQPFLQTLSCLFGIMVAYTLWELHVVMENGHRNSGVSQ